MENALENPDKKLHEIQLVSDEDRNQLLNEFNDTKSDFPAEKLLHQLFEEQVEANADRDALIYLDKKLTYRELNNKANQLAQFLRDKGVKADDIVAIYADRSVEVILAMLAVLKAGGAYVPVDPKYPVDRIKYMLEDSGTKLVLGHKYLFDLVDFKGEYMDIGNENLYQGSTDNPKPQCNSDNLAYIIYTSGSTGKPKGVMIEHHSVVNLCLWHSRFYDIRAEDHCAEFASFSFDASVSQIYSPLSSGSTLHIIPEDLRLSPIELNKYFEANNISYTDLPTQLCEQFMKDIDNKSLRNVTTGGEKLKKYTLRDFRLVDEYGPTEYTVITTNFVVDKYYNKTPIGKPLFNTRIYILDKFNNLQPIGVPGELCIAGAGLARGYLNRTDLTEQKFVSDPFVEGEKMYRTGDSAAWMPDGNIDYFGRIDFQVKIRGFRIELGEIEQHILKHDVINKAVVLAKEDKDKNKFLVAYFEASLDIDIPELKKFLSKDMPDYMIPGFFIRVDSMPLNRSGKVERRALPEPKMETREHAEYVAPTTPNEKYLQELWQDILDIKKISVADDFFELGGHSLKAAVMQSRLSKDKGMQMSLQSIFKYPTIKGLASVLDTSAQKTYSKIEETAKRSYYPTSSSQRRLYILDQMENVGITYNVPVVTVVEGKLNLKKLSRAIEYMVERHEVLRTSFDMIDGEAVQVVHEKVKFKAVYEEKEESLIQSVISNFIKPFDMGKAPLFRVGLIKLAKDKHLFIFDVHHIVMDGWSVMVFMKELWDLYYGHELPPKKLQYKDYAVWQQKDLETDLIKSQEKYWLDSFSDGVPVLNVETDMPRGGALSFTGKRYRLEVDNDITSQLAVLTQKTGTTLFMVLMSAYNVLLSKYSSQEDFVLGIPSSGRTTPDMEDILGMFVNSLPIRSKPEGEKNFREYLDEMKNLILESYDNQDFQLDVLIEKLGIKRDSGRNPLFDVMFSLRNKFDDMHVEDIVIRPYDYEFNVSKFDFSLEVIEKAETLDLLLEYRKDLYHEETMIRMGEHYINILKQICKDENVLLKDIDILTDDEKHFLLEDYNSTKVDYPKDKTIIELFEEQVRNVPENIALECNGKTMSYLDLNEKTNRLGRTLRTKGVRPDDVVVIILDRSIEFVVSVLAVLKAGGAFLPLDPEYPDDRISYIIESSEANILISDNNFKERISFDGEFVDVNDEKWYDDDNSNPEIINTPKDLVYLIYTSGSTGRPKGVMLTHEGLNNYITWARKVYLKGEDLDFPLYSSISFDLTETSIFTPLLSGNRMVIYSGEDKNMLIENIINDNKIGVLKLTPTHLKILDTIDVSKSRLKRLIVGGEDLKRDLAEKVYTQFNGNIEILNEYGPTEAVIGCMIHEFNPETDRRASVPIGVPGDNVKLYILDSNLNPVPKGVVGELYIAGDGVARGYKNLPEITAERFIPDPFHEGERMYKSGDLTKFLPNGVIEFMGRIDYQVKIRGYRIEMGEIEKQLAQYEKISDQVVVDGEDKDDNKYLCAYYVSDEKLPVSELKEFIKASLPDYMVPAYFIHMEKLPLTPNGKVDTKNLPKPDESYDTGVEFEAPRNEKEKKIAKVFSEVLNITNIGINDNFFDMGGNSIKAVALVADLQSDFEVKVNDIFQYQTIADLAENIQEVKDDLLSRLETLKGMVEMKVSPEEESKFLNPDTEVRMNEYLKKNDEYKTLDFKATKRYENIFVAGGTGFLGVYILRDILTGDKANVYVPVRGKSEEEATERLKAKLSYYFGEKFYAKYSNRIYIFKGDLSLDFMGIPEDKYDALAEKVDCVINSAAIVKHYGHYKDFYSSNVLTTENLLAFAYHKKRKDFNHVSTISIGMGSVEGQGEVFFTEYELDMGQKSDNYYLQTKLEAEKKVVEAREQGMNTNIFRVGNITFDSESGLFQENIDDNGFFQQARSFINLSAIPDVMDEVEFSFVDQVSQAILHLYNIEGLQNEIHHISNIHQVKLSQVLGSPELDLNVITVSFPYFIDLLINNYQIASFKKHVETILLHRGWLEMQGSEEGSAFVSSNARSDMLLNLAGFSWKHLDIDKMNNMVVESLRERTDMLKKVKLFEFMDAEDMEYISRLAQHEYFAPDADMLWQGEHCDRFYIITEGVVEISRKSISGWHGSYAAVGKDNFIGVENVLSSDSPSPVTAEAILDNVIVLSFKAEDIKRLLEEKQNLGKGFFMTLAERVRQLESLLVEMG
ncbi:MAG: amino acid adenylation domain-containing protein [Bacteroidales bacterium]|nr:amino acid adenylation domain-containing protein [Bacteroidales bacterium]